VSNRDWSSDVCSSDLHRSWRPLNQARLGAIVSSSYYNK
jgi:hypothetical protein